MIKKSSFGLVFNTLFSVVFSVALTLFVKFSQGNLSFETLLMGSVPAIGINFTLGTFIPLVKVGNGFAGIFVKEEKHPRLFYFLRMFAIVLIMTLLMSTLVTFSEIGFKAELVKILIFSFPSTFLYAYIVGCIVFPPLFGITARLCTKEESI